MVREFAFGLVSLTDIRVTMDYWAGKAKRGRRRRDKRRMKRKARRVWRGVDMPERWADHLAVCSCPLCGNPRRHWGERTRQELIADDIERQQLEDIVTEYCELCGERSPVLRRTFYDRRYWQACKVCWSELDESCIVCGDPQREGFEPFCSVECQEAYNGRASA